MEQSFGSTEGRGDQDGCLIAPTSGAVCLASVITGPHRSRCMRVFGVAWRCVAGRGAGYGR